VTRSLGIDYEPRMIERTVSSSSFIPRGTAGFRPEAVEGWRSELDERSARWLSRLAAADLAAQGYAPN
jgi:hypothetical protein